MVMRRASRNAQPAEGARRLSGRCCLYSLIPVLSLWCADAIFAQTGPTFRGPAHSSQDAVRQAAAREDLQRPLPSQIQSMPVATERLDVVERRSQLLVARNRIARTAIADPSIIITVQYTPNEFSVIGLQRGSTTMMVWFEGDPNPVIYLVTVTRDPELASQKRIDYGRLEQKLAILFPNSKVYLIPLSRKIIVKGQAKDAQEAANILSIVRGEVINQEGSLYGPQPTTDDTNLGGVGPNGVLGFGLASGYVVNMLQVPGEYQVALRVRVAELNRSMLREMATSNEIFFDSARQFVSMSLGGSVAPTLTGIFENGEISFFLRWLATNGTAKILAEPTLTVLSGRPASFHAGGEFAVPTVVGIGGAQGATTTFRGYGTSLVVTPTVLDGDLIRLKIMPEFSSLNQDIAVNGIPGVDSRFVQTEVELREGQTIVLAGLIGHFSSTNVSRIPVLGDLPWIGPLFFSSKKASQDETELIVMVTPEIVRPMDADEVPPVPGFQVTHPNDYELYKHGMTEGAPDTGVYQLAPFGHSSGHGVEVGYGQFNPAAASPMMSPVPTDPYRMEGAFPADPSPAWPPQGGRYQVPPPGQTPPPVPAPDPSQTSFENTGPGGAPSGIQQAGSRNFAPRSETRIPFRAPKLGIFRRDPGSQNR